MTPPGSGEHGTALLQPRLEAMGARAEATPEVVGLLVLGSFAMGTADSHSDLDLGLYVTEDALPAFDLRGWLEAIHPVAVMFHTGYAWTAWFTDLVRVEIHFGTLEAARDWAMLRGVVALPSLDRVILLDRTGVLADRARALIGPPVERGRDDSAAELLALADDLLVADGRRRRGELAAALARLGEGSIHLARLARAAEHATGEWVDPARRLERALSPGAYGRYARIVVSTLDDTALSGAIAASWQWALELRALLGIGVLDPDTIDALDARLAPAPGAGDHGEDRVAR